MIIRTVMAFLLMALLAQETASAQQAVLFREEFDSLDQWEPLMFPKVKAHSTYSVVKEGDASLLKAESHASASAIVHRRTFNVYETPRLRWRWRVEQLSDRGDPKQKAGDDYPIRVYVMFAYDPTRATLGERLTYGAARAIYGRYPPHGTLNYVWTGRGISERIIQSPYTDKAFMVVLEKGKERAGSGWRSRSMSWRTTERPSARIPRRRRVWPSCRTRTTPAEAPWRIWILLRLGKTGKDEEL